MIQQFFVVFLGGFLKTNSVTPLEIWFWNLFRQLFWELIKVIVFWRYLWLVLWKFLRQLFWKFIRQFLRDFPSCFLIGEFCWQSLWQLVFWKVPFEIHSASSLKILSSICSYIFGNFSSNISGNSFGNFFRNSVCYFLRNSIWKEKRILIISKNLPKNGPKYIYKGNSQIIWLKYKQINFQTILHRNSWRHLKEIAVEISK